MSNQPARKQGKAPLKSKKYAKAAPKPALTKEQKQKKYFSSLCDQIEGDHLENALKTTNKLLALDPEDPDALQAKLFLLLKTSKYQEALDITDKTPETFRFERAYALYRMQREKDAEDLLKDADSQDRAVLFLQAQISYRLGDYAVALETYNTLLSTSNPALEEYSDIQTNIAATDTNLNFLQTGFQSSIHSLPPNLRGQKLEEAPLPALTQTHVTTTDATAGVADANVDNQPAKPKPPRKSRVPKGVVPGVTPPPDPERWIKKSERTRVEGPGRKKKAGGGGATQGSTAPEQTSGKTGGSNKGKKKK
ncbi:hypothetical protein M408DRAFT_330302 [Serendipita vermifera MAFF 305830]|uniref:Signal recognition particle subunit SRP72 n=1 Tax=Serendipita vermifera MAFF 305830 TaxID=933852 RepID=A0A0C2WKT4_SERVB|nr:hypothetical protein M408DRAFT_330302 [Serendipita vermifera MAFF 305830]